MKRNVVIWVMLVLLAASILSLKFIIQATKAETIVVPVQYSSIQEAINAAASGDTILVSNGTYFEGVCINKSLNVVGESPSGTIIDGHVLINANNVLFRGFTVQSGTGGVYGVGLVMYDSSGCIISNDIIISCIHEWGYGMWISHSNNNTISENLITQNDGNGIFVDEGSSYNKIVNNTISHNSLFGICVYDEGGAPCIGNVINKNNMDFNAWGCIEAASCSEGTEIIGNKMANSKYGIDFFYCNMIHQGSYRCEATIMDNVIADCKYGIAISGAHGNNVTGNTVIHCTYGIRILYSTENNTVYHNNFFYNAQQVNMTGANTVWDDGYPSGGNYWSDYNGTDEDFDGIGDTPYIIDENNIDNYPLMYPRPFFYGDVNCDSQVDIYDVTAVCVAYNSKPGDPNWYPPADIVEPYGIIDIYDVTAVCINYGEKWHSMG